MYFMKLKTKFQTQADSEMIRKLILTKTKFVINYYILNSFPVFPRQTLHVSDMFELFIP